MTRISGSSAKSNGAALALLREVTQTGMDLAAIRQQIKTLRKKCVYFVCVHEQGIRPDWELSPKYDTKYWPCWKAEYQDCGDGTLEPVTAAEMREQDTWCGECLAREPVRKELAAVRAQHPATAAAHYRAIVKASKYTQAKP